VKDETEKVQSAAMFFFVIFEAKHLPVVFQLQAKPREVDGNGFPHFVQLPLVIAEDDHVIHVSEIILSAELLLDEMIHFLQVIIREPLRRIKAEG